MGKLIKITKESGIPLIGCIAFGCLDRGTNLIQVRPTTICPLNCVFCSTDAGSNSKVHEVNYEIELDYLIKWVDNVVKIKGAGVEINLDSVGEVMSYPKFFDLVEQISKIKGVYKISMQTNGYYLNEDKIDKLEGLGMNQINLSINSLDRDMAKNLSGCSFYDVGRIKRIAEYIARSKIKLLVAPVWIPGVNDKAIEDLIGFCKKLGCMIGIQKYEIYKYGRKIKGVKQINWWKFYKKLKEWEKKYDIKLVLSRKDMNIEKRERVRSLLSKGEIVNVKIMAEGWIKGQMIGVAKNRCISINNCKVSINDRINVKILENKNSIYVAEPGLVHNSKYF
jgi:uncharacterized Fe-S cluster-containing radical SAM superfamily enzyme